MVKRNVLFSTLFLMTAAMMWPQITVAKTREVADIVPIRRCDKCVHEIRSIARRCISQNRRIVRRCKAAIENHLEAGELDLARELASDCIKKIKVHTRECVQKINALCDRCVQHLLAQGYRRQASRLKSFCHRMIRRVNRSGRAGVRIIENCFPHKDNVLTPSAE